MHSRSSKRGLMGSEMSTMNNLTGWLLFKTRWTYFQQSLIVSASSSYHLAILVKKRENFWKAALEGECLFKGEHAKNLISAVLLYDIYSFWCCVLDNLIFMGLLHAMLNFWLVVFNTLVYLYKFLFSLSLPLFVPLLCSIVLVVLSCITLSTITLVP